MILPDPGSACCALEPDGRLDYHLSTMSDPIPSDTEVLGLLRDLEQQELDHERALKEYSSDRQGKDVLQFAPDLSLSMPAAPMNPKFAELLKVAIERERQSVRIYQATADLTGGQLRVILEELAGFERQHEDRLVALQRSRR
jgi:hypothetical protein